MNNFEINKIQIYNKSTIMDISLANETLESNSKKISFILNDFTNCITGNIIALENNYAQLSLNYRVEFLLTEEFNKYTEGILKIDIEDNKVKKHIYNIIYSLNTWVTVNDNAEIFEKSFSLLTENNTKSIKIEEMNLCTRVFHRLKRMNVQTLGDLMNIEIENIYGAFGRRDLIHLVDRMNEYGVTLSQLDKKMNVSEKLDLIDNYKSIRIEKMDFSINLRNHLKRSKIITLYDLIHHFDIYNKNELEEIIEKMENFNANLKDYDENIEYFKHRLLKEKVNFITIEEMGFSTSTYNCLKCSGIWELSDLMDRTLVDLYNIKKLSIKCLNEVIEKMNEYNVPLLNIKQDLHLMNELNSVDTKMVTIEEMNFSFILYHCLKNSGINTLGDLTDKTIEQISGIKNISKKHINEVIEKMNKYDVTLLDFENNFELLNNEEILKVRSITIDKVNFSCRTFNILKIAGINTLGDLMDKTIEQICNIHKFIGKKSSKEIFDKMDEYNVL